MFNINFPKDARDRYILCASWNVNAQMPSANEDITPWLVPGNQLPSPDVYVIGFQEIVDLTTGNVLGTTDEVRTSFVFLLSSILISSLENLFIYFRFSSFFFLL